MKKHNRPYSSLHILSSVFMMLALAWLTVCLPYVNEQQQAAKNLIEKTAGGDAADDDGNPLSNTNEEKNEGGASVLSEYLHDAPVMEHNFITLCSYFKCHPSDLYLAYHPELVIPPPEA